LAYLNSNSFYSSFARKKKGYGNVPSTSPFHFTGSLGHPNTGNVSGSAIRPPAFSATAPAPAASGGSGGGSPAPAAPQGFTVQPSTLPPDPVYQAAISALQGTEANTLAGLTQQRGAYLSSAGYTEDPTTHAISFDPNNPYSQAALLRQHYQQAKTGNTNSYAAAGQLYAGSLQNAQNATTDSYNASDNALTNAVINFLASNTNAQTGVQNAYDTGAGQALATSVQNAPNNPLYAPFSAAGSGGATVSTDANGNMAVTGGAGGSALVPQSQNSVVKLASGYSIVYGPNGQALYFLDPNGNRMS
jgi:hypothetical protein